MSRRRAIQAVLLIVLILSAVVYRVMVTAPEGPRSLRVFEPARMAQLELDMWQAYYRHERVRLFKGLVVSLHEQNRYSWANALRAGFSLARAASTFSDLRSNYEQVLPDLEHAYRIAKEWNNAGFDPAAVARAELAWWVARRIPGQNSPEQVGALIAEENALLYEVPKERVLAASILRARAGRLRDEGGEQADWAAVAELLRQSYRELHAALQ